MTVGNLAMVWAPNLLRCPSNDPVKILEYTVKEMKFTREIMVRILMFDTFSDFI
jgi:hypothetical protein